MKSNPPTPKPGFILLPKKCLYLSITCQPRNTDSQALFSPCRIRNSQGQKNLYFQSAAYSRTSSMNCCTMHTYASAITPNNVFINRGSRISTAYSLLNAERVLQSVPYYTKEVSKYQRQPPCLHKEHALCNSLH